ncbi:MAG: transporter substrate-binding domain-containing protein [Actinomycetota bacterium]
MRKFRLRSFALLLTVFALVGAACANDNPPASGGTTGATGTTGTTGTTGAGDTLLDRIMADGQIRVSTDPAYPPQSSYDEASGSWEGFDIDVAQEISTRLGLTQPVDWQTPSWDIITAGNWNDRWDISVGSMTVTAERAQVLDFTSPYYYTPAGLAVQQGSSITSVDQLAGKTIGVCGACTYESYLNRDLNITGYTPTYVVPENVTLKTYDTDSTAIQDLVLGRVDAVMSAVPTLQGAIDKDKPIQLLGDPVFFEPLAVAVDKSAPLDDSTLVAKLSEIIDAMHADGTLTALSMKWYGEDLTVNSVG